MGHQGALCSRADLHHHAVSTTVGLGLLTIRGWLPAVGAGKHAESTARGKAVALMLYFSPQRRITLRSGFFQRHTEQSSSEDSEHGATVCVRTSSGRFYSFYSAFIVFHGSSDSEWHFGWWNWTCKLCKQHTCSLNKPLWIVSLDLVLLDCKCNLTGLEMVVWGKTLLIHDGVFGGCQEPRICEYKSDGECRDCI